MKIKPMLDTMKTNVVSTFFFKDNRMWLKVVGVSDTIKREYSRGNCNKKPIFYLWKVIIIQLVGYLLT